MNLRITVAVAFLTLSALPASAQQPPAAAPAGAPGAQAAPAKGPAYKQFCAADIEKLCKDAEKNNTTFDCLGAHEKDLSADCSARLMPQYRAKKICQPDFDRLCKDAPSLGKCVHDHDADLSKECKAALVQGTKQTHAAEKAAAPADAKAGDKSADAKQPTKGKATKKAAKATKKTE